MWSLIGLIERINLLNAIWFGFVFVSYAVSQLGSFQENIHTRCAIYIQFAFFFVCCMRFF